MTTIVDVKSKKSIKASLLNPTYTTDILIEHLGTFEKKLGEFEPPVKNKKLLQNMKDDKGLIEESISNSKDWKSLHKQTKKYGYTLRIQKTAFTLFILLVESKRSYGRSPFFKHPSRHDI